MFVNSIKVNISNMASGTTATTINIPISMEYQMVDQSELVNRVFVDVETEKAINTIVDYEKVRFSPITSNNKPVYEIIYSLDLNGSTTYGSIGFTDDDIKFRKETFKQTFLSLDFYDTDNPLTQNLVSNITLFSEINQSDLISSNSNSSIGQTKPANQIPLNFVLTTELFNQNRFTEGFYLYDYKDEQPVNQYKFLYMRASFKNAKTGKSTNLMVKNAALPIDSLVHELYTKFKLIKKNNGYFYTIDSRYHGNLSNSGQFNNVFQATNKVLVNLYEIRAI